MKAGASAGSHWGVVVIMLGFLAAAAMGCVLTYRAGKWWLTRQAAVAAPLMWPAEPGERWISPSSEPAEGGE